MARHVFITRIAISPLFAIKIFRIIFFIR